MRFKLFRIFNFLRAFWPLEAIKYPRYKDETILILETRIFPLLSPRTKEIASIRFDFPDPFGPMIDVNRPNGPMVILPL